MKSRPGRVRQKLAALLQKEFPTTWDGLSISWNADQISEATGWYRSSPFADVYRWEAWAYFTDKPDQVAYCVSCWDTMTNCIKAGALIAETLRGVTEVFIDQDRAK